MPITFSTANNSAPQAIRCPTNSLLQFDGKCSCYPGYELDKLTRMCIGCAPGFFKATTGNDELCTACYFPLWNFGRSSHCNICRPNFFDNRPVSGRDPVCQFCENSELSADAPERGGSGARWHLHPFTCPINTTISTLNLTSGFWRIGPLSRDMQECARQGGWSPCRGGTSSIDYCEDGFTGPLCSICTSSPNGTKRYYSQAHCEDCPDGVGLGLIVPILVCVVVLATTLCLMKRAPSAAREWALKMKSLAEKAIEWPKHLVQNFGVVAKFKVVTAFFQCISPLPEVYGITNELPGFYDGIDNLWTWTQVDWLGAVVPATCLGDFTSNLVGNALTPLLLIFAMLLCGVLGGILEHMKSGHSGRPPLLEGVLRLLPLALITVFAFTPPVSAAVFAAWQCEHFDEDEAGTKQSFLSRDLSVSCDHGVSSEYSRITVVALFFVAIWPVGMPICLSLLLYQCKRSIQANQITPLVRATSFLHAEYEKDFFWWEPLALLQRLILTGFVLLVKHYLLRVLASLVVSIVYLIMLLLAKPFDDLQADIMCCVAQFCLVMIYICTLLLKIRVQLASLSLSPEVVRGVLAISDPAGVSTVMIMLVLVAISPLFILIVIQIQRERSVSKIRMIGSAKLPVLTLANKSKWHLYLSCLPGHSHSIAQEIRAQLWRLLTGCKVFFGLDDLGKSEDIEECMGQAGTVLLLLSSSYFVTEIALKEVLAAVAAEKPLILVHESRPGAPIRDLMDNECPQGLKEQIWPEGKESAMIPWHSRMEFQMVSLTLIAESLLLASERNGALKGKTRRQPCGVGSGLYVPGSLAATPLAMHQPRVIYLSKCASPIKTWFMAAAVMDFLRRFSYLPIPPHPTPSDPVLPGLVASHLTLSHRTPPHPIQLNPTLPHTAQPCPTQPNPAQTNPARPSPPHHACGGETWCIAWTVRRSDPALTLLCI